MSKDLDLKLRLTATDQGVAGTVRNTKNEVNGLSKSLESTSTATQASSRDMAGFTTVGAEAARTFMQQSAALEQTGHQFQDFSIFAGQGTNAIANTERQAKSTAQEVRHLGTSLAGTGLASRTTAKNMGGVTKAGGEATRMFKLQKGSLQQAGYQFQDLAVQIGGGTSAFVAIGQQGSQLLSILGPGGALLGAVLAVGSALGGAFFSGANRASDSAKTLNERIKDLELGYRDLTSAQRTYLGLQAEEDRRGFEDQITEQEKKARKLQEKIAGFESGGYIIKSTGASNTGGILGVKNAISAVTPEQYEAAQQALIGVNAELATLRQEAKKAGDEYDNLRFGFDKGEESAENARSKIEELVGALEVQAAAIGETSRQTDLRIATALKADSAQIKAINTAYNAIEAEERRKESLKASAFAAREAKRSQLEYERSLAGLKAQLDPIGTEFEKFAQSAALLRLAFEKGDISAEEFQILVDSLVQSFASAGEEAAKEFVNPFEDAAGRVSQAVQNAIASGDWATLGDAIGNTFAASMSAVVSDQITKSLADGLTAKSGLLAQAGAAFAGPLAGAVVGGAIQLAMSEISDYLSDDWDPTEMRQASQGTGTVLGSINEKSKSIAKAVDISADATSELVGINRAMLRALETVQLGIEGASSRVARGYGGVQGSIGGPGVMTGGEVLSFGAGGVLGDVLSSAADVYLDYLSIWLTAGLVDLGKLLGGKSKKRDEGIQIIGGYIDDLINSTIVQGYVTYRAKKHALDDYDTYEKYAALDDDVGRQFALVFGSIYDSVAAGLDVFGLDIDQLAGGFKIGTQKLSLEGLNAEQQQEAFEAYFSTVFDRLADYTVPWLDEFQKAGEGLGETLARVATQTQVTQQAIDSLGIRFDDLTGKELVGASQRLVELGGGLDQFISSMQGFIGNFASESQQFVLAQSSLTKALQATGLELPGTRQGFYELMQAQNGSTEEGAENIATLLRLQGIADNYYTSLEDQADELASTQRSLLQEAQAASGAISDALRGLQINTSDRVALRRESALETLQRITDTGTIKPGDQLNDALSAATQINASDFATFADYITEVSRAGAVLTGAQRVADAQVTREQRALESIERRLQGMQKESYEQRRVITQNTAKTARLLERIEGEPRALT